MGKTDIRVQHADFDLGREYQQLCASDLDAGAVAFFVGRVRSENTGNPIESLELQHYPGMTEKLIREICQQARQRWNLRNIRVLHRVGELKPGEQIVFAGASSQHRADALESVQFIMDYLKTGATLWKKEQAGGQSRWLEQSRSDRLARDKWQS